MERQRKMGVAIALGAGIGTALGVAFHNIPIGLAVGVAFGASPAGRG